MSSPILQTPLAAFYVAELLSASVKLNDVITSLQDLQRRLVQQGDDHGLGGVIGKLMVLRDNDNETERGAGLNSVLRSVMDRQEGKE
jgi:hypothetical protein